jgi:alpha-galactosidase
MSLSEYRVHYALWAVLASPLVLGTDVRPLAAGKHADCLALLLNDEILAVNQDAAGQPAKLVDQRPPLSANLTSPQIEQQIFSRPLSGGRLALLLLNRAPSAQRMSASWGQLAIRGKQQVFDVLRRTVAGVADGSFVATVPSHDVSLVVLTPEK